MTALGAQPRAKEPFVFADYAGLVMPTGKRAANLRELTDLVRTAPIEVLHHHLHRTFLLQHFGAWDFPNDFARWASRSLEDQALAEKLAALDPFAQGSLETAREVIVDLLEEHMDVLPFMPSARPGFEFHFASGHFVALPGQREVWTVGEMRSAIAEAPLGSIFYHFHEARLRGPDIDVDDLSQWIEGQFGPMPLVDALRGIDFYFYSLEELRERLVKIFDERS
jgi:hypothetical protein